MTYATGSNMIVTFLYMVICAPILEEYIFRKLIVDRTVKYGQGVAVVLSGLMFGLFHGNLNQFAYAFLLGMFLAFLYVKTGELKVTLGLHMCINFMGAVVSVLLLKAIHLEEYQEVIMNGADSQAVMDYMMKYLPGWIGYMIYVLFILAVLVTGIVLFIVYRKKLKLEPGQIAKGRRFKTVIGNPGMICYCVFWIAMIINPDVPGDCYGNYGKSVKRTAVAEHRRKGDRKLCTHLTVEYVTARQTVKGILRWTHY